MAFLDAHMRGNTTTTKPAPLAQQGEGGNGHTHRPTTTTPHNPGESSLPRLLLARLEGALNELNSALHGALWAGDAMTRRLLYTRSRLSAQWQRLLSLP